MNEKIPEKIEDKLFKLRYKTDSKCHLNPDQSKCLQCLEKTCTIICPANVYSYNETEKKITVSYEKCLECGACRIACKHIDWTYPKSGKGVIFKKS